MKHFTKPASAALLLLLSSIAFCAENATIAELLKDKKFDQKEVTVKGKVAKFLQKKSKAGDPYFLFKLTEKDQEISVFGHGELKGIKDGDKVTVVGEFAKARKSGSQTYKNEIDVSLEKKGRSVKLDK